MGKTFFCYGPQRGSFRSFGYTSYHDIFFTVTLGLHLLRGPHREPTEPVANINLTALLSGILATYPAPRVRPVLVIFRMLDQPTSSWSKIIDHCMQYFMKTQNLLKKIMDEYLVEFLKESLEVFLM